MSTGGIDKCDVSPCILNAQWIEFMEPQYNKSNDSGVEPLYNKVVWRGVAERGKRRVQRESVFSGDLRGHRWNRDITADPLPRSLVPLQVSLRVWSDMGCVFVASYNTAVWTFVC